MSPFHRTLALAALVCAGLPAAQAAGVKVSFVDADAYADAGNSRADREANLAALATHLSELGQRLLPADSQLEIEVLEVDLAGIVRPTRRGDIRVTNGGADWPRMTLRYRLVKDGQVQMEATERIADMHYTMHIARSYHDSLPYERRMLNDWFRARFADRIVATAR